MVKGRGKVARAAASSAPRQSGGFSRGSADLEVGDRAVIAEDVTDEQLAEYHIERDGGRGWVFREPYVEVVEVFQSVFPGEDGSDVFVAVISPPGGFSGDPAASKKIVEVPSSFFEKLPDDKPAANAVEDGG